MKWESGLSSWRKAEDIGGEDDVDWTEQTYGEGETLGGICAALAAVLTFVQREVVFSLYCSAFSDCS